MHHLLFSPAQCTTVDPVSQQDGPSQVLSQLPCLTLIKTFSTLLSTQHNDHCDHTRTLPPLVHAARLHFPCLVHQTQLKNLTLRFKEHCSYGAKKLHKSGTLLLSQRPHPPLIYSPSHSMSSFVPNLGDAVCPDGTLKDALEISWAFCNALLSVCPTWTMKCGCNR
jgi:hypothetical protein